jgi:hypothetical protein
VTGTIRIVLSMTGRDTAVDAYPTPAPGLVIHRAPGQPGEWWSVTHVPSGTAVSSYLPSPEAALACAIDLGLVADWTQSLDRLQGRVPDAGKILWRWGAEECPAHQVKIVKEGDGNG